MLLKSRVKLYGFTSLRVMRHKTSQLVCRIEFYRIESESTSLPIRVYEFTSYEFTILRFYEFTKFSLFHNFEVKNKNIFIPNNVYIHTQSLSISYFGSFTNPKRCCVCVLVAFVCCVFLQTLIVVDLVLAFLFHSFTLKISRIKPNPGMWVSYE